MAGLMRSWTDFASYESCNVLGLERLIEASREVGVRRFVQISTSSVYGTDAVGDEGVATRPVSPYGVTKLAAEHLLLAHVAVHGFPATILRYFSIYGPRQRPDMAYHIFTEALIDGKPLVVYGDGFQSRANTFVTDAVAGTIAAIDRAEIGGIYNIGGGEEITLLDAIGVIADALGVEPDVRHEPARPGDQRRTWADVSRARRTFGYEPAVAPRDGLPAQVRWHLGRREAASGA
jgi:nucleoside-diphosphate-sugar epimerase